MQGGVIADAVRQPESLVMAPVARGTVIGCLRGAL